MRAVLFKKQSMLLQPSFSSVSQGAKYVGKGKKFENLGCNIKFTLLTQSTN